MEPVARELGLTVPQLANGVIRLVNANMVNALKLVSVRRGHDPRDFVLVAYGGGGAMHAAALGAELQVRKVVVPPHSGVFSAWGMLLTEPHVDLAQTRIMRTADVDGTELTSLFDALEEEALAQLAGDGLAGGSVAHTRSVDMRYAGQEHAVRVPVARGRIDIAAVETAFHAEHRRAYTFELADTPIELVTFHVASRQSVPKPRLAPWTGGAARPEQKGRRQVDFDVDGIHDTPVYERAELPAGFGAGGPCVVEEATTTTLVHPGQDLSVDRFGNLVVEGFRPGAAGR
jgi:N-methylhydantoinase A